MGHTTWRKRGDKHLFWAGLQLPIRHDFFRRLTLTISAHKLNDCTVAHVAMHGSGFVFHRTHLKVSGSVMRTAPLPLSVPVLLCFIHHRLHFSFSQHMQRHYLAPSFQFIVHGPPRPANPPLASPSSFRLVQENVDRTAVRVNDHSIVLRSEGWRDPYGMIEYRCMGSCIMVMTTKTYKMTSDGDTALVS